MKKWQWNSCILMAIIIVGFLYFTKERIYRLNSNYANDFNALFLNENTDFIDSLDLQTIRLEMTLLNANHIQDLQALIDDFEFEKFQKNNNWRPIRINYNQKSTAAEFRVHGNTPNGQSVGDHVSLAIRSKTPILGKKRFNLIIYERITVNADRIAALGNAFNLYFQEADLVAVEINDKKSKLYYLETPIDEAFLGNNGLVNFELSTQKSPVFNQLSNLEVLESELEHKIEKSDLSYGNKRRVKAAYSNLNNAIIEKDVQKIQQFFDLDYIARFQVARFIAGFQNHGFSPENMLIALDTSNFLFYPILHRDNYFGQLDTTQLNSWTPYYYDDVRKFDFEILRLITENIAIFERTKNYFNSNQSRLNELIVKLDAIDIKHSKIMQPVNWIDFKLFENETVQTNKKILKHWLNRSRSSTAQNDS